MICPNCGSEMVNEIQGVDYVWVCHKCEKEIVVCPNCGTEMVEEIPGVEYAWNCPKCKNTVLIDGDGVWSEFGDGYSYEEVFGIPEGCATCGNAENYPNCQQGCSLFDDD